MWNYSNKSNNEKTNSLKREDNSLKTKKVIKLINDERLNVKTTSAKGCDVEQNDHCYNLDAAQCWFGAYDTCATKDLAACINNGTNDVCFFEYDVTVCYGGQQDYT